MVQKFKSLLISGSCYYFLFHFKIQKIQAAIVPKAEAEKPNYSLNDLVQVFVNISQWILGVVGSLTLLMFVYGGFLFLFSGGNSDRANKGKQTLLNAVIGLFVVFLSYMIVGIVFKFTNVSVEGTAWSKPGWFQ